MILNSSLQLLLNKSVEKNRTILRKVNTPETLTNDKGQMTNDSLHQLALFAPTYLYKVVNLFIFLHLPQETNISCRIKTQELLVK
ncbi:hypothetical protein LC653_03375 [Nostoc sp. CHAB 5784]|nr:hypothetical protein [Nostoc mirabile CHAB5784]